MPWRRDAPVPRGWYLQERIAGVPGSVVFAADGDRAMVFGLSRQLVGEREFGASGFRYSGSLLVPPGDSVLGPWELVLGRATALAAAATRRFGLMGVNGIDFIARGGVPWPIEVNPRYSASMELVERGLGVSVFGLHTAACEGRLSETEWPANGHRGDSVGKAVLYAPAGLVVGDTRRWLEDESVADIPHPGERIARGSPICTVFARGRTTSACHAALRRRAAQLYREVLKPGRKAA